MKLRKIGNSLGTTFSRETLQKSGLTCEDELEVFVELGEIRLRRSGESLVVEFNKEEADALILGKLTSKSGKAALSKIKKARV